MKWVLSRRHLWESVPPPLKQMLGPVLDAVPPRILLGGRFRRRARFLEDAQWWPADRLQAYQLAELRRICRVAYEKTPYYRRAFDAVGFHPLALKRPEDLSQLPTIDRDVVRHHLGQMCSVSPRWPTVDYTATGGLSGVPLSFYINTGRSFEEYAHLVTSWNRVGYTLEAALAVFRGRIVRPDRSGLRHTYDPILRQHHYSTFYMTDTDMKGYVDHMSTLGPCYLHVYPSSGAALARFLRRCGRKPPANVRGIIAESEIVYPDQRAIVEEVFGCPYFSCYGQTEKVVLAAECERSADYHVWPTYGYFELLDAEGRPVRTPGERGEIVGTGFINTVVPFVRYRTGDWATYVADRCENCGREHPIIRDIRGHRIQEVLVAASGSEIPWAALNMHDDTFAHVNQFQFSQDMPGRAVLRIVPGTGFGEQDVQRIRRNLDLKLEGQIELTIERVEAIAMSPRGKAIYVDQRIEGVNGEGS